MSHGWLKLCEFEISDINPRARRVRGGVWNEDVLPVVDWESADRRVVLPMDLQRELGIDAPVLRWPAIKYQSILKRHARDIPVIHELSRFLATWVYVGQEPKPYEGQYRVLFTDDHGRWYALTIGPDRTGSYNVITIFGGSDRGFLRNRLRNLGNVVCREK